MKNISGSLKNVCDILHEIIYKVQYFTFKKYGKNIKILRSKFCY